MAKSKKRPAYAQGYDGRRSRRISMVEQKNGLSRVTWQESLRNMATVSGSGGELRSTYQKAIDLRQTANEGDYIGENEVALIEGVMQTISSMPEKLRNNLLDEHIAIEYDYSGNTYIRPTSEK
ncbi:MAG TPA: hypothetical protein PLD54_00680 [Candidatus Levybacteria bacterium]|nr:hypothetical protein [Candidatus Levybacteria bacterium]